MMKLFIHKLKFQEIILYIGMLLIIFQGWMKNNISLFFTYSDEIFSVLIVLGGILSIKKNRLKLSKEYKAYEIIFIVLIVIGLIGNIRTHYQTETIAIFYDAVEWCKFFLVFLYGLSFFDNERVGINFDRMTVLSKAIIVYSGFLAVGNHFFNWNLAEGYGRFGMKSYSYPGSHVAFTVAVLAFAVSILSVEYKKNFVWMVIGCLLAAMTLRFKGIGYCVLMGMATIILRKKIKLVYLIVIGFVIIVVAYSAIEFYFLNSNASRAVGLRTGIEIANTFFPTGAGIGTYGTTVSSLYYSKAYSQFGISERNGFTMTNFTRVADGGEISVVAGQFGWIGIFLVGILLLLTYSLSYRSVKEKKIGLPFVSALGYMVIAASSEGMLTSEYVPLLAVALSLVTVYIRRL